MATPAPCARVCFLQRPVAPARGRPCQFTFRRARTPIEIETVGSNADSCVPAPPPSGSDSHVMPRTLQPLALFPAGGDRRIEIASSGNRALAFGKRSLRLHGCFSYARRPRSKPVASTIFPLVRAAPIPRGNQNCRRSGSAASLWPRAAYGASVRSCPIGGH